MAGTGDHQIFQNERRAALDAVLKIIDGHIQTFPKVVLNGFTDPAVLEKQAEADVWRLFKNGVTHLREGAPGGNFGSISAALSKTSLRSSALAASLGVKPPQFEDMHLHVVYATGGKMAEATCLRLIDAAEGDLLKSSQIIGQKIGADHFSPLIHDTELKKLEDQIRKSSGIQMPEMPPDEQSERVREEAASTFNALLSAYGRVCESLRRDIGDLSSAHRTSPKNNPPKP